MASLHEDLKREDEVVGSSNRAFGLTVGGILVGISVWWALSDELGLGGGVIGVIGLALVALGAINPRILAPLNKAWIRFGLVLSKFVSPVALGIIYATTIVPIGLLMRVLGKNLLRLRREPQLDSYWIMRDPPGPTPQSITNQF